MVKRATKIRFYFISEKKTASYFAHFDNQRRTGSSYSFRHA